MHRVSVSDLLCDALQFGFVARHEDDVEATCGELHCILLTDAVRGSRNECPTPTIPALQVFSPNSTVLEEALGDPSSETGNLVDANTCEQECKALNIGIRQIYPLHFVN